jgi:glycosyltransferase involved in cell wall biosynthesis
MKKVVDVVPYTYLPFFSGGQKSIALFLEHLANEVDLTVVTTCDNDQKLVKDYSTLPWLKKESVSRYTDISLIGKLISQFNKENVEAVIWEHPYFFWLARIIKKRTGIKTVFHTHNIEHQRFRSNGKWWWPLLQRYEKWCFRCADFIFFISEEDRSFAIEEWGISKEKCMEVPFGVDIKEYPQDKIACKEKIAATHSITANEKILLFNGLLDYKPNLDALLAILNEINPMLLATEGFRYKIIICGKRLPEEMNSLKDHADKNIIYAGFVDDIETYFKGADLFLNPVQSGGGIKTKMVESIGFGTTVIATKTGAHGISKASCDNKLVVVEDNDWAAFAKAIIENVNQSTVTPQKYYEYYYWGNIARRVAAIL